MTEVYDWDADDTLDLLKWIQRFDNRDVGESNVLAWTAAARAGRWVPRLAQEAVVDHHVNSSDYCGVAHIHAYVRAHKQDEADRAVVAEMPPPADPAKQVQIHSAYAEFAQRFAIPDPDAVERDGILLVSARCDHCKAHAESPCTRAGRNADAKRDRAGVAPHHVRHELLRETAIQAGHDPVVASELRCPTCNADPGWRCVNLRRGCYVGINGGIHYARMTTAA